LGHAVGQAGAYAMARPSGMLCSAMANVSFSPKLTDLQRFRCEQPSKTLSATVKSARYAQRGREQRCFSNGKPCRLGLAQRGV